VAQTVGAPFACATSNCATALHLALKAAGVGLGDEVITVSHSFIATAAAITYQGAVPVFVDIEPATFNMDPDKVENLFTKKTKAILAVHQMGMPCNMARLVPLARKHGLALIEDAACAIGSEIRWEEVWEPIGKPHGDVACFSFHPRKLLTSGEGGMLTTRHAQWDAKFRLWRQHGMSIPDTVRHASRLISVESYDEIGFNYRMTDFQAAVVRVQLGRLSDFVRNRRRLVGRYRQGLRDIPGVLLPMEPNWARSNWQSFCIRLNQQYNTLVVMRNLLEAGISTRKGIMCSHSEPAFFPIPWLCQRRGACECEEGVCEELGHSEQARRDGIILPLYEDMTDDDQDRVIEIIKKTLS
jgi:dTDP-4-amino-4,6-dideoxygalactose transaminase